tara:strand:+ start:29 stop:634 length:606 start_codon:yes stop_codon:yes gene_type:complete
MSEQISATNAKPKKTRQMTPEMLDKLSKARELAFAKKAENAELRRLAKENDVHDRRIKKAEIIKRNNEIKGIKEPEPKPEPVAGLEFDNALDEPDREDEPEQVFDKVKDKLINPPKPRSKPIPKKKVIIEESESGSESDGEPVVYVRKTTRKKKQEAAPPPPEPAAPEPVMNFNPYNRGMPPSITRRQPVFNPFHGMHRQF